MFSAGRLASASQSFLPKMPLTVEELQGQPIITSSESAVQSPTILTPISRVVQLVIVPVPAKYPHSGNEE